MKRLFKSWLKPHLKTFASVLNCNEEFPCDAKINETSTKTFFTGIIPNAGDSESVSQVSELQRILRNRPLAYEQKQVGSIWNFRPDQKYIFKDQIRNTGYIKAFFHTLPDFEVKSNNNEQADQKTKNTGFNVLYQRKKRFDWLQTLIGLEDYSEEKEVIPIYNEKQFRDHRKNTLLLELESRLLKDFESVRNNILRTMKGVVQCAGAMISKARCDDMPVYTTINHRNKTWIAEDFGDKYFQKHQGSDVYHVKIKKDDESRVAIKVIELDYVFKCLNCFFLEDCCIIQDDVSGRMIPTELYWMRKVKNIEGCSKLVDEYVDEKKVIIVAEYINQSLTLQEFMSKIRGKKMLLRESDVATNIPADSIYSFEIRRVWNCSW